MDKEPNRHHIYERTAIFVFGVVFVIGLLVLAIIFSEPTDFQYMIFRIVLALATAGVAVFIPGFIEAYAKNWVRAGGAIAVFVVVYFFSPASFVTQPKTKPNLANSNEPSSAIVNPQAGDRATQVNITGHESQITINQGFSKEQLRQVLEEYRQVIQEQNAKGVSKEATAKFFKRLGEENVDPSKYETRLLEFADEYLRLKERIALLEETHEDVLRLRNKAYHALDNAELDRARFLLREAIQIKETKRNHEKESGEEAHNNLTEQDKNGQKKNIQLPPGSTGGGFDPDAWTNSKHVKNIEDTEYSFEPYVYYISVNLASPNIIKYFTPSGLMGDAEASPESVELDEWYRDENAMDFCIQVSYNPPTNGRGWAGIYWQNEPDNWGDNKGENFSKKKYKEVTFSARGEVGTEIVEFKAGGINFDNKTYKDSFEVSTGKVLLGKDWKRYSLSLADKNLESVIGGFCWVTSQSSNPDGLTFYLASIRYE